MSYTAEVSRTQPTCILFMIDQSRSMDDSIHAGDKSQRKAIAVSNTINRWLQELSLKCAQARGVGDYYDVGVIGYGGDHAGPAFVGAIGGRDLVPISEIADNPGRLEQRTRNVPDGSGGLVEQMVNVPVWFDPVADGGTPMCGAAAEAYRILQDWIPGHPDSFPPIVIHITDGEATDGDPKQRVAALSGLKTRDGNALLFNIHLSANPNASPVIFPDSARALPDAYSKMLFETSSLLTPKMRQIAKDHGIKTSRKSRAFVLNSDMLLLVQAIDIGTRAANDTAMAPLVMDEQLLIEEEPESYKPGRQAAGQTAGQAARATTGGRGRPCLTVLATGQLVDAAIEVDAQGRILEVIPAMPLDPTIEYKLGPSE